MLPTIDWIGGDAGKPAENLLNAINSATQFSVMRPPSAKLGCHPVQRNAATFGDHQRVCKVSSTPEACVGLGRCPVRAQGSKGAVCRPSTQNWARACRP